MHYSPRHSLPAPPSAPSRAATVATTVALASVPFMASPAAAVTGNVWDRVAACESGGNWAINTGNGFYGGLQFTHSTWIGYGGGAYANNANLASKSAQITVAQRTLAGQGPGAWPVCSVRAGLTRVNGAGGVTASRATVRPTLVGPLVVDGILGPKTTARIQAWVGTTPDGVIGPLTRKALQVKVHATADGVIGPKTVAALQTRIGMPLDGASRLNSATIMAVQRYLR